MKNVKVKISGGFMQCNTAPRDVFRLSVQDGNSRSMIIEVDLLPDDLYRLLGSRTTEDRCNARVWDSYNELGLNLEIKHIVITDERLHPYRLTQAEYDAVIDDHRAGHEIDGWVLRRVFAGSLSKGQHSGKSLRVTADRYVEVQP